MPDDGVDLYQENEELKVKDLQLSYYKLRTN